MELVRRFFQDPGVSFFLFGPRGTGKSTWVKQQYPQALLVDLLRPDSLRTFVARPERLEQLVEGNVEKSPIVIDEIQKAPVLLEVVHRLMESGKGYRFVLTGSSARKLRRGGVDLLAGRATNRSLHPFMAAELGEDFDIHRALQMGLLPVVHDSARPEDTLNAYISLCLQQEVQAEGIVRSIGDFARFLEAASFSHASLLNTSEVARECQVGRKTVEGYLSVAEDLLIAFRLPVFSRRAKRQLVAHPKFYFFDAGVYRSLRPHGPLDRPEEIEGAALEGLVCQHLRAWTDYGEGDARLYFWRTKSGNEVDFVVYGSETFTAVEVKNTAAVRNRDLNSLKAFGQDYPQADRLLVYRGSDRLKIDGIVLLPCERYLKGLVPGNPMPR